MKIKIQENRPHFSPVKIEIEIETKGEADTLTALFGSAMIDAVTSKVFGTSTLCLDIPGSSDNCVRKFHEALQEFFTLK